MTEEKEKNPNAKRNNSPILVYCLPEEKQIIKEKAEQAGLSVSSYLLNIGLNKKIVPIIDYQNIMACNAILGNIRKIGGLLKLWLSNDEKMKGYKKEDIDKLIFELRKETEQAAAAVDKALSDIRR